MIQSTVRRSKDGDSINRPVGKGWRVIRRLIRRMGQQTVRETGRWAMQSAVGLFGVLKDGQYKNGEKTCYGGKNNKNRNSQRLQQEAYQTSFACKGFDFMIKPKNKNFCFSRQRERCTDDHHRTGKTQKNSFGNDHCRKSIFSLHSDSCREGSCRR